MSSQKQNAAMNDLLAPVFQKRNEPNFAIANAIPTMLQFPELRGLWCASVVDENGALRDLAAQGRTLANTAAAPRAYNGLAGYVLYDGATQWHSRADEAGLDITGMLTWGGWFYFNAAAVGACLTKYTTAGNQKAYWLGQVAGGVARASISTDGLNVVNADTAGGAIAGAGWQWLAGRFTPNTEVAVFLNRTKATTIAGVPATVFNSNAALMIAGQNAAASLAGRCWIAFLSATALSDTILNNAYEQTRAAFGV